MISALIVGGVELVRRRLQSGLRTTLVGSDAPMIDLHRRADEGLFGPASVTWRVNGDASVLVGGVRALLLQTLHPRAMAGVADHSAYRGDPTGRLWRTARYVGTTTFGTTDEAVAAIRGVQRVHRHVVGTTPEGEPYSASDPHLLAYVQATLVQSFVVAHDRFGARPHLSAEERDRYVAEQARITELFDAEDLPDTWRGLTLWMRDVRPELHATPAAREAVRFLLAPPLPVHLRAPYAVLAGAAVSTLPVWARRRLRLPVLPVTERLAVRPAAAALTRVLGWALAAPSPGPAGGSPADLRRARAVSGTGAPAGSADRAGSAAAVSAARRRARDAS